MDPLISGVLLFVLTFVLMFLNVHVAIALGITSIGFLFFYGGTNQVLAAATKTYTSMASYTFIAVPLFLLMAEILVEAALTKDLFTACSDWLGFMRGGVAQATILACTVFAAMCGASAAAVAAFGVSATPEMERLHYPKDISFGIVVAGATLAILIPPSIPLIVYGSITEQSVGQLFMAGVIPGIILAVLLMLHIAVVSAVNPAMPKGISVPWAKRFRSLWAVLPPMIIVFCVLGTIYIGIATPTEAAGIGAAGSLLVALAMKRLTWTKFAHLLLRTAKITSMIVFMVATAMVFGYILTLLKAPQAITTWVISLDLGRWGVIVAINLLLLSLGCIMDALSMMVILCPILYPIVISLGFDPIWFGVIFVINMEIGLLTPPFGINLFVFKGIRPDYTMGELYRGVTPFCITLIAGLAIMTAFPALSTWLPSTMIKVGGG